MADSKIVSSYLTVIENKRYLVFQMENGSAAQVEIEKTGHKLQNFLRVHGLENKGGTENAAQYIGQTFKS